MFYQEPPSQIFRFGDVLKGFVSATPVLNDPASSSPSLPFSVEIQRPLFSVVLSPCCSISDKIILLVPLIQIRGRFFDNPYFAGDMTRINRVMDPEQAMAPQDWEHLPDAVKTERLLAGRAYALVDLFVYQSHGLFPKYKISKRGGNIETDIYMIDFRNAYRLNCEKIVAPGNSPVETKCLELSVPTRSELREKIASFYGRVPREDAIAA
jgi:hypothetical protein